MASTRRTPGSGTKRLSISCTASTSQTVSDSTGPKPRRAPGSPRPQPPMSSASSAACSSHPATRAGAGKREGLRDGQAATV